MKKILLTLILFLIMSSVGMAAPLTDLQKGDSSAGYLYWNPSIDIKAGGTYDIGNATANGIYVETAVGDKVIVGIETMKGSRDTTINGARVHLDTRFTDFTAQYKINDNFRLIAGDRNYDTTIGVSGIGSASESSNKFIYGVGALAPIGDKTSAYATYLHDDYADEWQIGVNHDFSKQLALNVNYRYHDEDSVTLKGIGVGIIYKF
jgi:opacity protein-like surface antigen